MKRGRSPTDRTNQGRAKFQLHIVCDRQERPIIMLLSEGQMSDHKGAHLSLNSLLPAKTLIADHGDDSKTFREAVQAKVKNPAFHRAAAEFRPIQRTKPQSKALKDRDPHRQPEGLVADRNPLRAYLLVSTLHRRNRHLLAAIHLS